MTDLLTTIKETEQLVRKKHQPGQHPQDKHTPTAYGKGGGGVSGMFGSELERASKDDWAKSGSKTGGVVWAKPKLTDVETSQMGSAFLPDSDNFEVKVRRIPPPAGETVIKRGRIPTSYTADYRVSPFGGRTKAWQGLGDFDSLDAAREGARSAFIRESNKHRYQRKD